jgi:hypothetical protein
MRAIATIGVAPADQKASRPPPKKWNILTRLLPHQSHQVRSATILWASEFLPEKSERSRPLAGFLVPDETAASPAARRLTEKGGDR